MTGYHSRDQMTNDIFFKMVQVLAFYLGLLSLSFLSKVNDPSLIIVYFVGLCFAGLPSLYSLKKILYNMIECKIALRKQCVSIESKIKKDYLTQLQDDYFSLKNYSSGESIAEYCEYVEKNCSFKVDRDRIQECYKDDCKSKIRRNILRFDNKFNQHWDCVINREGSTRELDEERKVIKMAAWLLMAIWALVMPYLIYHVLFKTEVFTQTDSTTLIHTGQLIINANKTTLFS